jgi:hypothetical protein
MNGDDKWNYGILTFKVIIISEDCSPACREWTPPPAAVP